MKKKKYVHYAFKNMITPKYTFKCIFKKNIFNLPNSLIYYYLKVKIHKNIIKTKIFICLKYMHVLKLTLNLTKKKLYNIIIHYCIINIICHI